MRMELKKEPYVLQWEKPEFIRRYETIRALEEIIGRGRCRRGSLSTMSDLRTM